MVQILGLFVGIREYRKAGSAGFKKWMKMGLAIAVVYGVTASLFSTQVIIFAPHWMQRAPGTENQQLAQVALGAFLGLSAGAIILGLIYSTIIPFIFGLIDRPSPK